MTAILCDPPREAYHADMTALSQSMLKVFMRSPLAYRNKCLSPREDKQSAAMRLGDLVHSIVLAPERVDTEFADVPEGVKAHAMQLARTLRDRFGRLLELPGIREKAVYWTDPATGLRCRMMVDLLVVPDSGGPPVIVDLKVTADIKRFGWTVRKFDYPLQDAHYVAGIRELLDLPPFAEDPDFVLLVIDKAGKMAPQRIGDAVMERARNRRRAAMEHLRRCLEDDSWPEKCQAA